MSQLQSHNYKKNCLFWKLKCTSQHACVSTKVLRSQELALSIRAARQWQSASTAIIYFCRSVNSHSTTLNNYFKPTFYHQPQQQRWPTSLRKKRKWVDIRYVTKSEKQLIVDNEYDVAKDFLREIVETIKLIDEGMECQGSVVVCGWIEKSSRNW